MTPVILKVLERIVYSEVIQHLEVNNLLHSPQHDFRSGRSLDINLLESYGYITKLHDPDLEVSTFMILLDFCKAFDKVCHKRLTIKLPTVKLEEKSLLWILDFLHL